MRVVTVLAAMALWTGPAGAGDVAIQASKEQIDFLAGNELIARYHIKPNAAKPYFWPVNGPGGVALTRAYPMEEAKAGESKDHEHQKSLWFCYGDVIPEGIELKQRIKGVAGVDFWSERPGHGRIVCVEVGLPKADKDHGKITTRNEWRTADGTKIMDEERTIHLYDFADTRLLVVDIDLHAGVVPITFGDTKEGAMGVRVNDAIAEQRKPQDTAGKVENADGKVGEKACWGQTSAWCDYWGPIDGQVAGIAILDDPANPHRACWHSRGYGLMAANPFGRGKSGFSAVKGRTDLVRLDKGKHLQLRYGVLLHAGDTREGKVEEYYQRFVRLKEE